MSCFGAVQERIVHEAHRVELRCQAISYTSLTLELAKEITDPGCLPVMTFKSVAKRQGSQLPFEHHTMRHQQLLCRGR